MLRPALKSWMFSRRWAAWSKMSEVSIYILTILPLPQANTNRIRQRFVVQQAKNIQCMKYIPGSVVQEDGERKGKVVGWEWEGGGMGMERWWGGNGNVKKHICTSVSTYVRQ